MKKEIILGGFFLAIMSLAFFRTIISKQGKLAEYPYRMKLYYSQIDGIKEGTSVYVKGIESGFVFSIDVVDSRTILDSRFLEPSQPKAIELTLALKEPITLWDNYRVRFTSKTVFSDRVIDIEPGFQPGDDTVYYNPTYLVDSKELSDFFPSAKYIDNFFEASNAVMTENQDDIRTIAVQSREISEKLLGTEGTLPLLINTSEMYDELDLTLAMIGITMREGRRYQEGYRKMEQTHPIPFLIHSSFMGGTTLGGRRLGGIGSIRESNPF